MTENLKAIEPTPDVPADPRDTAAGEPAVRLVGAMHLFGRTSPPVLLFQGSGALPQLLAHLADELDSWRQQGTVPEAPAPGGGA